MISQIKYLLFISLFIISCQTEKEIIEPEIDLSKFVLQEDFKIETIASEPLIEAPVAMTFDNQGRVWVMEMPDYMPNIHGSDEDIPRGRIVILEDQDSNGRMDHSKVFLEKLSQPRAMALVYGGLLYAEAPNLWFVEIENDLPVNKVLVDSLYAVGGNVEHQPNGLMMNLDNWIYNAKCSYRYRRINGEWKKEPTKFRGQWGLTHDDYGRLFYNDNSNPLYGDYVMPNQITNNSFLHAKTGVSQNICVDRNVYPLHATAVNRGYMDGMLHEDNKLVAFTSACSPLIYRGEVFGTNYQGNAFVCAPEGNLVKRIILNEKDGKIEGTQAWKDKEFLATTDEGFRPVNLNNAPDGSIYITDMHRGIIQHKVYMTVYLKDQIENRKLDTIINAGRIFRVAQKGNQRVNINLEKLPNEELCELLKNKNGWFRDRAQQLLIYRNAKEVIPQLEQIAINSENHLAQLHALWTLEGMGGFDEKILLLAQEDWHPKVINTIIRFLENSNAAIEQYQKFFKLNKKEIDIQLSFSTLKTNNKKLALAFAKEILERYPDDEFIAEAIISGSDDEKLLAYTIKNEKKYATIKSKLNEVINNKKKESFNPVRSNSKIWTDDKTVGRELFNVHCAACHGIGGDGIENLAPPLFGADLVELDADAVTGIILHGLEGEIHIKGKPVKFNSVMPGLNANPELTDEKVAAITAYVKNAFSKNPQGMKPERVGELRKVTPQEGILFSEEELLKMYK